MLVIESMSGYVASVISHHSSRRVHGPENMRHVDHTVIRSTCVLLPRTVTGTVVRHVKKASQILQYLVHSTVHAMQFGREMTFISIAHLLPSIFSRTSAR